MGTNGHHAGSGLTVLVVDDCPDTASSLATLPKLRGHFPHVARTGPDGLALARQLRPHVVLLDIRLPDLSGYEVARELRRGPGAWRPVLVAVTGFGTDEDRRRSREA